MFNTLAQYFLGTSNNSNNLDPGSKTNNNHHQEVPTNHDPQQQQQVEQALAQQNVFQVYPNKRGRARRNRKNKVQGQAPTTNKGAQRHSNSSASNNHHPETGRDSPVDCASPDFLLHGITTRVCEEGDEEWLFVECAQKAANKKGGIISLHDDLLEADLTCVLEHVVYEPPKPRFEIKHNPLNLNQQQLKRQLRQQNTALISCEDIEDDEELKRSTGGSGANNDNGGCGPEDSEEIQVIAPEESAVVEGNSVDVEVPPVAVELPVSEAAAQQQQQQAHGDEEPSDQLTTVMAVSAPVTIKNRPQKMDESWFVTPPSCFTSQGPVHMETSPLENLLIEHPSMSVYHGARSMVESADIGESLVVLEKEREVEVHMEDKEEEQEDQAEESVAPQAPTTATVTAVPTDRTPVHTNQVAFDEEDEDSDQDDDDDDDDQLESTTPAVRSERPYSFVCNREEKQSIMFRNAQMNHDKKMRQKLCRNAMTRSNKTCEMNATKNGPKKRSEKQHAKNASRANNNRKC